MAITVLFTISVVFHLDNRTKAQIHTCAPRQARATFWVGARIHVVMTSISMIPDEVPVSAMGIWKRGLEAPRDRHDDTEEHDRARGKHASTRHLGCHAMVWLRISSHARHGRYTSTAGAGRRGAHEVVSFARLSKCGARRLRSCAIVRRSMRRARRVPVLVGNNTR